VVDCVGSDSKGEVVHEVVVDSSVAATLVVLAVVAVVIVADGESFVVVAKVVSPLELVVEDVSVVVRGWVMVVDFIVGSSAVVVEVVSNSEAVLHVVG
jgi:hypothetical protein